MKKLIVFISLCFLTPFNIFSQNYDHPWGVGFHIGISEYNGDMGNGFLNFKVKPTSIYGPDQILIQKNSPGIAGISLSRYLNSSFDIGLSYSHGEWGYVNNDNSSFFFRRVNHIELMGKWKFLNLEPTIFNPYLLGGLGYRNVHIMEGTIGLQHELTLPLGLGLNIKISEWLSINAQSYFALTSADAGDGIFNQRNDQFWNHTIGLTYHPNFKNNNAKLNSKRSKCPKL